MNDSVSSIDIAVVGMSGAFPGAHNISQLWENLLELRSGIMNVSEQDCREAGIPESIYSAKNYVKRAAWLNQAKQFDAAFFGYSDAEAEIMDPQHRLFLEHAWAALESACYIPDNIPGVVGVFASCGLNRYLLNKISIDSKSFGIEDFQKMLASDKDFLATRVSYKLNLKGPGITVQSGCSSSLVAVQMGCTALQTYQVDMVLCGGVSINVPHKAGYVYEDGLIFSPDGFCRPFSNQANGTVFGEGVGVVALKRLDDALADGDPVIAVIQGAAINNDGSQKVGFTAPSVQGQAEVIAIAQALANVDPAAVDFIETHGTGTRLGDPIEIAGLREAFGQSGRQHCALGALKAEIGHLDAAAGIAAFIKAALVVQHRIIPPMRYADDLNPELKLETGPFYCNALPVDLTDKAGPVIAGVSSFGVGGTNVHVVLASPPATSATAGMELKRHNPIYSVISAKSAVAAKRYQDQVLAFAKAHPEQSDDLAYTLFKARKVFDFRGYVRTATDGSMLAKSTVYRAEPNPGVTFLFPGQGMQRPGMARSVYASSTIFQNHFDQCIALYEQHDDVDLAAILLAENSTPEQRALLTLTEYAQPALFITEYALARTLMDSGVTPQVMIGHSLGEYVAACLAGVFSLKAAMELVCLRGRLMGSCEDSAMLAVFAVVDDLTALLPEYLEISLLNAPTNTVISGTPEDIQAFQSVLQSHQIPHRQLSVSKAFHSRFMEPILAPFRDTLEKIQLRKPNIAIVSMCGEYQGIDMPLWDTRYWLDHLRKPVDFNQGAMTLLAQKTGIHIEVGPGHGLHSLVAPHLEALDRVQSITTIPMGSEVPSGKPMAEILLDLWCVGCPVGVNELIPPGKLINGPTYPFSGNEYWLPDLGRNQIETTLVSASVERRDTRQIISQCWAQVFRKTDIPAAANFMDLGGDSLIGVHLAKLLSKQLDEAVNIATVMRHPSIDSMVEFFGKQHEEEHFGMLFSIDKRGNGTPIFLISGAHEDRYTDAGHSSYEEDAYRYFSTLVHHLGGQRPVYGFRPRGIFSGEEFHSSVEAMAEEYITKLKAVQPKGPYIVGGECVGGIVAYEMARQLLEQGDAVQSLILMDTHFPSPQFRLAETSRVKFRRAKRRVAGMLETLRQKGIASFVHEVFKSLVYLSVFLFPFSERRSNLRNEIFGSQIYLDLLLGYEAKPIPIKINLLINEEWWKSNPTLGWDKSRFTGIQFQPVSGDHKTRLTTHGEELGNVINGLLL